MAAVRTLPSSRARGSGAAADARPAAQRASAAPSSRRRSRTEHPRACAQPWRPASSWSPGRRRSPVRGPRRDHVSPRPRRLFVERQRSATARRAPMPSVVSRGTTAEGRTTGREPSHQGTRQRHGEAPSKTALIRLRKVPGLRRFATDRTSPSTAGSGRDEDRVTAEGGGVATPCVPCEPSARFDDRGWRTVRRAHRDQSPGAGPTSGPTLMGRRSPISRSPLEAPAFVDEIIGVPVGLGHQTHPGGSSSTGTHWHGAPRSGVWVVPSAAVASSDGL